MAMTTSFGYTDAVATSLSLPIPTLSYSQNFARDFDKEQKSKQKGEIFLTNTTSPFGQPEIARIAIENVGNIYNGSNIATENQAITRKGVSLLVELNDTLAVFPEDDTSGCCCDVGYLLPFHCHVVLRVPVNQVVTADMALTVLKRNIGFFFDGDVTSKRLNQMLRGTLSPLQ